MGTVISVNTGRSMEAAWAGRIGRTAIDKRPRTGLVRITASGLDGDERANVRLHGTSDSAVYVYSREDMDWWEKEAGRQFADGMFGENLTLRDVGIIRRGSRWQAGTALLEATGERVPCKVFARWTGEEDWVRRFACAGRPGTYFRVVSDGFVRAGDIFTEA